MAYIADSNKNNINGNEKKMSVSERFFKASKIIDNFNNNNFKNFTPSNPSKQTKQTIEIEFADDSAPQGYKSSPIKNLYGTDITDISGSAKSYGFADPVSDAINSINSDSPVSPDSGALAERKIKTLEYSFDDANGIMLNCKIEEWNKGFALFGDFIRDAKKYYKKTCISAKFIYFFSYRPMYRELNHEQLCWYLFWRSRVRDGEFPKTGLSYIFLYIYEQINLADIIGHDKVYDNIIKIWKNYRTEFPRMDKYVAEWLIDFALIHKIKINLNDIENILTDILNLVTVPEIYLKDDFFNNNKNTGIIIKTMSVYDYTKSKFYSEKNKELFDYHIERIVHSVLSSDSFDFIVKKEIEDGVKVRTTRESFMGAVCVYDYKKKITIEYKNLYKNFYIRECITDIIRYAENIIRDYLAIKSKLAVSVIPEPLKHLIDDYKTKYLTVVKTPKISVKTTKKAEKANKQNEQNEQNHAEEPEAVEFNPNIQAAAEIEKSSWDTTMTLVELQNRDGRETTDTAEIVAMENLTSFADGANPDSDDDGEFIAIDTGDPENYTELEEIAPVLTETTNDDVIDDIFDVLETLENAEVQDSRGNPMWSPDEETEKTTDIGRLIANLSADEFSAVEMLINADNAVKSFDMLCTEFLSQRSAILESVIDVVNEKALDFTGDIIFDTASLKIIEEYRREITENLKID